MTRCTPLFHTLAPLTHTLLTLLYDGMRFMSLCLCPSPTLAAEPLFLRKQLAMSQERNIKPKRTTSATRLLLVWLSRWFDWQQAFAVVQLQTFLHWHRQAFRLFWWWKSRLGRPPIPPELQALIRHMAWDNPTWGQERIANELLVKLGLRVSPRTVRKYMPRMLDPRRYMVTPPRRWLTFVQNHAQEIVACDFCVVGLGDLSSPLRVWGDGARDPPHSARQCHGAPHCTMDPPTAARSGAGRPWLSLPPPRQGFYFLHGTSTSAYVISACGC